MVHCIASMLFSKLHRGQFHVVDAEAAPPVPDARQEWVLEGEGGDVCSCVCVRV